MKTITSVFLLAIGAVVASQPAGALGLACTGSGTYGYQLVCHFEGAYCGQGINCVKRVCTLVGGNFCPSRQVQAPAVRPPVAVPPPPGGTTRRAF